MSFNEFVCAFVLSVSVATPAIAQQVDAPEPQPGRMSGTVTDVNGDVIPGADVILEGPAPEHKRTVVANDNGSFAFDDLKPGVSYHVTINADGFVTWSSPIISVSPGQYVFLTTSKLDIAGGATLGDGICVFPPALPQNK